MSRIILVGLFFLFAKMSIAQTIQILNASNSEPVEGAIIYMEHNTNYASSDEFGYANIGRFKPGTQLIIQHPSFHVHQLNVDEIDPSDPKIYLKEKVIRIDEIVISANKWEQNKSEIPFLGSYF